MNNSNSHTKRENNKWSKRSLQTFNRVDLWTLIERDKEREGERGREREKN